MPFIPSHRAAPAPILKVVVDLLSSHEGDPARAESMGYPAWEALGRALPQGARLLLHEEEVALGIDAAVVRDHPGDQGALYWGEPGAQTPREVWRLLEAQRVTHLAWATHLDHGNDTVASGLVFFDFVAHHAEPLGEHGGFSLARLPAEPPPAEPPGLVAYFPCGTTRFAPGLYPLGALARGPKDVRPAPGPLAGVSFGAALERARFLVLDVRCHPPLAPAQRRTFELLAARDRAMLFSRRPEP